MGKGVSVRSQNVRFEDLFIPTVFLSMSYLLGQSGCGYMKGDLPPSSYRNKFQIDQEIYN